MLQSSLFSDKNKVILFSSLLLKIIQFCRIYFAHGYSLAYPAYVVASSVQ